MQALEGSLATALALTRTQSLAVLGAARAVAHADGPPGERSRRLLSVLARGLGVERAEESAATVDLAAAFPSAPARSALVDALVIPACIEGEVTLARQRAVQGIAARLGVRSRWAGLLGALRRRRVFTVKRTLASRSPDARRLFRRIWQEEGVPGVLRVFTFLAGLHRDRPLAARYRALASCPAGSFGRAVSDHFASRGLGFPGEKNGMPERMLHHDLLHVLNGYDTDPAGECELGAFYAAFAEGDAFTFIVTVLSTFQLGLRVSPAAVRPARGAFDPERALAGFLRGRRLRVDVMGQWNYWELMPLPIREARRRLGLEDAQRASTPREVDG